MSGVFLYFLPGATREEALRPKLAATWLANVWPELANDQKFARATVTQRFTQVGPNGSSGMVVAMSHPAHQSSQPIGFFAERQTWREIGALWIGVDNEERPSPESLVRVKTVSGHEVELGDGNIWNAPIIRAWQEETESFASNVPATMGIDASGQFVSLVRNDYADVWHQACNLWDQRAGGITNGQLLESATRFIGLNYRIGSHEAFTLELFDTQNAYDVVSAALDLPSVEAWASAQDSKKNQPTVAA